jgi:hypothetical protein
MYDWVSGYPTVSGYANMHHWPTYEELCDMFEKLANSKNVSNVLGFNYPAIKREGDKFTYGNGENDL